MRYVIAVVMLAGCAAGPQGPQGERGPQGDPGASADVSALQATIAGLRAELDAVKARPQVKVPHLIVKETGEDLGIVTGPGCYYSEAMKGEACPWDPSGQLLNPYFTDPDCKTTPYTMDLRGTSSQLTPWNGHYYRAGGPRRIAAASFWSGDFWSGKCGTIDPPVALNSDAFEMIEMGLVPAAERINTAVELR